MANFVFPIYFLLFMLRPYVCGTCEMHFGDRGNLEKHENAVHKKLRVSRLPLFFRAMRERELSAQAISNAPLPVIEELVIDDYYLSFLTSFC